MGKETTDESHDNFIGARNGEPEGRYLWIVAWNWKLKVLSQFFIHRFKKKVSFRNYDVICLTALGTSCSDVFSMKPNCHYTPIYYCAWTLYLCQWSEMLNCTSPIYCTSRCHFSWILYHQLVSVLQSILSQTVKFHIFVINCSLSRGRVSKCTHVQ